MGRKRVTDTLRHALLERLMHYYYYVGERLDLVNGRHAPGEGLLTVSSAEIAQFLNMDDTLVRKDLAAIGVRGYPRVGFRAVEVMRAIRDALGFNDVYKAIIVGAGRMGGALATYTDFSKYGLFVVAAFDVDADKHGRLLGDIEILPMQDLEKTIIEHGVRLAILTVPVDPAQDIADRLVAAGVRAIWNFAPTKLTTPDHVVVRHEHISVGLAELAYHLKRLQGIGTPDSPPDAPTPATDDLPQE